MPYYDAGSATTMDDELFITKVNEIARKNHLKLPALKSGELPPSDFLDHWGRFLEDCVKTGIALSDDRWQRMTVRSKLPHAIFALDEISNQPADPDFRVGLQLLMGLLGGQDERDH